MVALLLIELGEVEQSEVLQLVAVVQPLPNVCVVMEVAVESRCSCRTSVPLSIEGAVPHARWPTSCGWARSL
jgi:hypothetical protein